MLKRNFYLFIILLSVLAACKSGPARHSAQSKGVASESSDSSATAKIEFAGTAHNFGDIVQGEIVTHTFKFKNTGNKPLLIKNIETSCGCLSADYDKKPVPPGEEGSVEIKFDTEGIFGKQYKIITIFADIPEKVTEIKVLADIKY